MMAGKTQRRRHGGQANKSDSLKEIFGWRQERSAMGASGDGEAKGPKTGAITGEQSRAMDF